MPSAAPKNLQQVEAASTDRSSQKQACYDTYTWYRSGSRVDSFALQSEGGGGGTRTKKRLEIKSNPPHEVEATVVHNRELLGRARGRLQRTPQHFFRRDARIQLGKKDTIVLVKQKKNSRNKSFVTMTALIRMARLEREVLPRKQTKDKNQTPCPFPAFRFHIGF